MKRTFKTLLIICAMALCFTFALTGCEWFANDCEHVYDNCADTECNVCGEKRDSMHTWVEADCATPKTCKVCGETDGEALGHSYTVTGYDDYYHYQKCALCGDSLEESKSMHLLDGEYACECGMEYVVEIEKHGNFIGVYLYNSDELVIKELGYIDGEFLGYYVYYYENDKLIKDEEYTDEGVLRFYIIYEYDERGNETKYECYNSDGTLDSYALYTYDKNGNETEGKLYLADGTLDVHRLYEYEENGNRVKETCEYSDGYKYVTEYENDENGNCVKELYASSGGYECVIEYEYDDNENLVKLSFTNSDGYEYVTEYEYDESKNLVKESYADSYGDENVTEYEHDEHGHTIKITQRFYDAEGNVIKVETVEIDHDFSADWKNDAIGHWHPCQNEGCNAGYGKEAHKDENTDAVCDICSYELGYTYDANTQSYIVFTESGLEAVFALGGNAVLNNDIELTNCLKVSKDITLDLNGKAITNVDSFSRGTLISVERGTLTVNDSQGGGKIEATVYEAINVEPDGILIVNGGSITSTAFSVYIDGTVIVNGGTISCLFGACNYDEISVSITGGTILILNVPSEYISSITGGTFCEDPSEYVDMENYDVTYNGDRTWTVTAK